MVPGMGPPPAGPGMLPPGDDFDPLLFQAVMGQLIQAYPEMIGDRVMLTNVAMQQTYLLHMYMKGQCQGEGQEAPVTVPGLMNLQGAGMSSDSNIFLGSDVSRSVESTVFSSFHPPISSSPVMSAPVLSTSPSSVPSSKVDTVKDENTTKRNNSVNKNSEILTKGKIVSTKDGNNLADKNHEVSSNKFIEKSNSDCSGSRASLERKPPGIYHPTAKSNDNGFNAGKNSGLSKVCPKPAKDKIVSPTQQNEVSASKITYMDGTKSGEIQENITEMENIKATTDGPRDFMRKSQMDSARPGQMDFLPDFAKKHNPCNMNTKVVEKLVNRLDDQVIRSIDNSDSVHFVRKPLSSASSAEPSRVFALQSGEFPTLKDSDTDSGKAGQNSRPMKYVPPGLAKRKPDGIVEAQLQMPTKRPSKPTCLFQNGEDWDCYQIIEQKEIRVSDYLMPGLSLEKVSKPVSKEISGKGISDISNIPAPKTTNKETLEKADLLTADEKENTDEWCEVKSRKRYKSPEMPVKKASQSRPQTKPLTRNRPIMTNFEKLISRLREEFPGSSRQTLIEAVIKIRTQRGNLSGMTMEKIVESAHPFITKQKKFIPGLSLPPRSSASNNVLNIPKFTKPGEYNNTFTARHVNQGAAAPKSALNCPWTAKSSTFNNTSMTKLVRQSKPAQKTVVNLPKDVPPPKVNKPVIVDFKEDICAICHDDLSMMEIKTLDCHHVYHYKCISQWVERERTCPTCRKHALFPEDFPRLGK